MKCSSQRICCERGSVKLTQSVAGEVLIKSGTDKTYNLLSFLFSKSTVNTVLLLCPVMFNENNRRAFHKRVKIINSLTSSLCDEHKLKSSKQYSLNLSVDSLDAQTGQTQQTLRNDCETFSGKPPQKFHLHENILQ